MYMKVKTHPDNIKGFDNALMYAIEIACTHPTKSICDVLKEVVGCTVISTIDDPESLNTGLSLIDGDASELQLSYAFYSGILLGYITAVEFASEEDLMLFTLKWA